MDSVDKKYFFSDFRKKLFFLLLLHQRFYKVFHLHQKVNQKESFDLF